MDEQQGYPLTMYATPDTWGGVTIYGDVSAMVATIESLKAAGGPEWNGIKLSDCTQYELISQCDGGAAYRPRHVRHDYNRDVLIMRPQGGGWFDHVETFNATYDVDELEELGVNL